MWIIELDLGGKPGMEEAGVMKAWFFLHMYNAEYGGLGGVAHW